MLDLRERPERPQLRVRERAAEQSTTMADHQQAAIRVLANELHRLNQAVVSAVEMGISVEIVRSARHHSGDGNWGDLLVPVIMMAQRDQAASTSMEAPQTKAKASTGKG